MTFPNNSASDRTLEAPIGCTQVELNADEFLEYELPTNGGQLVVNVLAATDAYIIFGYDGSFSPQPHYPLATGTYVFNFHRNSNTVMFWAGLAGSMSAIAYVNQVPLE